MAAAAESQFDAMMGQAQALQPIADAGCMEQVDGALFEQAGANALFDVLTAASLEHNGLDAGEVQQVGEHEARGTGADNADLCALIHLSELSFRRFIPLVVVLGRPATIGSL